ncbi:hypothetical protein HY441_00480 [Candidatus Microgenomates bacterium]|nr:hypothetical protein [Candidatus Microgenomates bacterium]
MAIATDTRELHPPTAIGRLFEILPGASAWLFLFSPVILSFIQPLWVAYLIIGYDLLWLVKAFGLNYRLIRGYRRLNQTIRVDWRQRLRDLDDVKKTHARLERQLRQRNLEGSVRMELEHYQHYLKGLLGRQVGVLNPQDIWQAVIVATYNETLDTLEPTIQAVAKSHYPLQKIWLYIAYEERGGKATEKNAHYLVKKYGHKFGQAIAVKHPADLPGEIKAKAGNITYACRKLTTYVRKQGIDSGQVLVTTLDADNRPHPQYFAYLSFIYATSPERTRKSYQPLPMFYNNIWDAAAPMRVIATGNTFWQLMEAMRPHRLRNFSAHAQSLKTLIDTNYWNVASIVEDGHQFWRTYFRYDGDHQVVPLYVPVYQDAVLARGYWRTYKAQFLQLRRWAWGASDIAYVFTNNINNRRLPWLDKWIQFTRLYEGHFSWATAPLILALAAWLPLLLNPSFSNYALAYQLPIIASRIQQVALVGIVVALYVSFVTLPPRPPYYKKTRSLMMVVQWALLPLTTIFFASFAALNAQTRLMLGRYLDKFDITEKASVKKPLAKVGSKL